MSPLHSEALYTAPNARLPFNSSTTWVFFFFSFPIVIILKHSSSALLQSVKHTFQRIASFPGNKLSGSAKCLDGLYPETLGKNHREKCVVTKPSEV
jgi:hypothetical protein